MRQVLENARGLTFISSAALVWLCSVAPLALVLIPLLMPVMQHHLHLAPREVGLLASADLVGACLASMSAPFWLTRISRGRSALIGLIVIALSNGLGALAVTPTLFLFSRFASGVGMGLVLSSGITLISLAKRPARLMSAIQVLQLVVAAAALSGAGWLLSIGGPREVLFAVTAAIVLSLPLAWLLPTGSSVAKQHLPSIAEMRPGALALLSIFIYFASVAIITNYSGKLGVQNGLSVGFLSAALAIGNLGALPGSLMAMLANDVSRQRLLLVAATLLQCVAVAAIVWMHGGRAFASAFFVIQICITVMAPLQVALLIHEDTSGRAIEALGAMQILGQAMGPISVMFVITETNVDKAYYWSILYIVLSTAMIVRRPTRRRADHRSHRLEL